MRFRGQKYTLSDETVEFEGHTLRRITYTDDFKRYYEMTRRDRPRSADLSVGGFIEGAYNLRQDDEAVVTGEAKVFADGQVRDSAIVTESAVIAGNAGVYGSALVRGTSRISEWATVSGHAVVSGNAEICGKATVGQKSKVSGPCRISGYAMIAGECILDGNVSVEDLAVVDGKARVTPGVHRTEIRGKARVTGTAVLGAAESGTVIDGDMLVDGNVRTGRKAEKARGNKALSMADAMFCSPSPQPAKSLGLSR